MEQQIIGLVALLAIYGALWVSNLAFGIANNLSKGETWDWKKFFAGWRTAILGAIGFIFAVGSILLIPSVFAMNGIAISEDWQKAISLLAIIAGIGAGILTYAKKVTNAIVTFFNPDNIVMEVSPNSDNWNKGGIETITGPYTDQELEETSRKQVKVSYVD